MKPAIRVDNLSKLYRIGRFQGTYRTLRESLTAAATAPLRALRRSLGRNSDLETTSCTDFWALKDVSFEVQPGEVVGLIGRNGAGKSTLLKILSRITEPTEGRVTVRGRMGSLLEVGTGFHHELTGRENIFLNGAILGMASREIQRKFDEIVAFAEIEQFLDTPVKRYSSGMYVRLAFAVAAYLEPEILLVDEVLAVGDIAFQKKCIGRMNELSRSGRTVIFVSHQMASITNLCESAIVLEGGRIEFMGEAGLAVERYATERTVSSGGDVDLAIHANRRPGLRPLLRRIRLLGRNGSPTDQFHCGAPLVIEIWVDPDDGPSDLHLCIAFEDPLSGHLFRVGTHLTDSELSPMRGPRRLRCSLSELPLVPGQYWLTLNTGPLNDMRHDWIERAICFNVMDADYYGNGILRIVGQKFLVRSHWQSFDWN